MHPSFLRLSEISKGLLLDLQVDSQVVIYPGLENRKLYRCFGWEGMTECGRMLLYFSLFGLAVVIGVIIIQLVTGH